MNPAVLDLLFVDFLMLQLGFTCERPSVVLETEAFMFWRHLQTNARSLVIVDFSGRTITRFDHDAANYPTVNIDTARQDFGPFADWLMKPEPAPFEGVILNGQLHTDASPRWKCGNCHEPLISCQCDTPQWTEERGAQPQ